MDKAFKKCEVVQSNSTMCGYMCPASVEATMYNNDTKQGDGVVQSATVGLSNMSGTGGTIQNGMCVAQIVANSPLCGPGTKVGVGDHAGKCVVDLDAVCGRFVLKDSANHQCIGDDSVQVASPPPE